jgi:hypothetical protein
VTWCVYSSTSPNRPPVQQAKVHQQPSLEPTRCLGMAMAAGVPECPPRSVSCMSRPGSPKQPRLALFRRSRASPGLWLREAAQPWQMARCFGGPGLDASPAPPPARWAPGCHVGCRYRDAAITCPAYDGRLKIAAALPLDHPARRAHPAPAVQPVGLRASRRLLPPARLRPHPLLHHAARARHRLHPLRRRQHQCGDRHQPLPNGPGIGACGPASRTLCPIDGRRSLETAASCRTKSLKVIAVSEYS